MKRRIPLLKDHHSHPYLYAALMNAADLCGAKTKEEALSLIGKSRRELNVACGWNDSRYSFTSDEIETLPPIVIVNTSLHRFILNAAAQNRLLDSHPAVSANHHNPRWIERNFAHVLKFIMELNRCEARLLADYFESLLKLGIWHTQEMSLPGGSEIEMLFENDLLDRTVCWTDLETYRALRGDQQEKIHGIKLFADGSLGARTAALGGQYVGGGQGILNYTEERLAEEISKVSALKKSLSIHAVGDAAISQVVRVLGKVARGREGVPEKRIEHCQFISKADAIEAKSLGVILSMQPNFSNESLSYSDRLPSAWRTANNPFRMLIDGAGFVPGTDLLLGSDGMPAGAKVALQSSLFPPYPSQRIELDEFTAAYCMPDERYGWIDLDIDEGRSEIKIEHIHTGLRA